MGTHRHQCSRDRDESNGSPEYAADPSEPSRHRSPQTGRMKQFNRVTMMAATERLVVARAELDGAQARRSRGMSDRWAAHTQLARAGQVSGQVQCRDKQRQNRVNLTPAAVRSGTLG